MASPSAKYSKSARRMTSARPTAIAPVEPHKTRITTHGIRTAAVATRFQVIEKGSLDESLAPSHHIKGNKSRARVTNSGVLVPKNVFAELKLWGNDISCPTVGATPTALKDSLADHASRFRHV